MQVHQGVFDNKHDSCVVLGLYIYTVYIYIHINHQLHITMYVHIF